MIGSITWGSNQIRCWIEAWKWLFYFLRAYWIHSQRRCMRRSQYCFVPPSVHICWMWWDFLVPLPIRFNRFFKSCMELCPGFRRRRNVSVESSRLQSVNRNWPSPFELNPITERHCISFFRNLTELISWTFIDFIKSAIVTHYLFAVIIRGVVNGLIEMNELELVLVAVFYNIRLETKSCRILPLTYDTKYDMT